VDSLPSDSSRNPSRSSYCPVNGTDRSPAGTCSRPSQVSGSKKVPPGWGARRSSASHFMMHALVGQGGGSGGVELEARGTEE
jgi:hypothetical protein